MSADRTDVPLIGLAHGSRHPGVSASIADLMAAVSASSQLTTAWAFLDLTEPDLSTAAQALAEDFEDSFAFAREQRRRIARHRVVSIMLSARVAAELN